MYKKCIKLYKKVAIVTTFLGLWCGVFRNTPAASQGLAKDKAEIFPSPGVTTKGRGPKLNKKHTEN